MPIDINAVPFLRIKQVENIAEQVLQAARIELDIRFEPPIDIETIAEHYFGMQIIYRYLSTIHKKPDLHGALFIWDRKLEVEESLSLGRTNFTIGHELGHWVLHRHLAASTNPDQSSLLDLNSMNKSDQRFPIICRSNDNFWKECQANWFSAALLMPVKAVRDAFKRNYSCPKVFSKSVIEAFNLNYHSEGYSKSLEDSEEFWGVLSVVDQVKKSGNFSNVSDQALRIRLQTLGLITDKRVDHKMLCPSAFW